MCRAGQRRLRHRGGTGELHHCAASLHDSACHHDSASDHDGKPYDDVDRGRLGRSDVVRDGDGDRGLVRGGQRDTAGRLQLRPPRVLLDGPGTTPPSRADFNPPDGADISNDGYGRLASNEQVLDLGGTAPTYQGCAADNRIEGHASAAAGTTFCIVETGHRIAGLSVKSVGKTESGSSYVTLDVTVWQNSQSS